MTWLGFVVIGILVLTAVNGYRRGFIKEIVSFFFVFLSVALAWAVNPYVNDFLMEETPIYEKIEESCAGLIQEQNAEDSSDGEEETAESGAQNSYIEKLGLPEALSQSLMANNTEEVYSLLAVDTFRDYLSGSLAHMIINGLSYVLSWLIASIVVRIGSFVLNLLAAFPLIRGANRLAGALVGIVKGILFVWIGFLVLTILCSTGVGRSCLNLTNQDPLLKILYKYDIFVNFFMNVFYG